MTNRPSRFQRWTRWLAIVAIPALMASCGLFSGPDASAPTITSTEPSDGASKVPTSSVVRARFNLAMDASSIDGATFSLIGPDDVPVSGTVSYSAASLTATFTPAGPLAVDTVYTATVSGAVTNVAGSPLGLSRAWSFTTASTVTVPDTSPPQVVSTFPLPGQDGIATNSPISATFSEAIDASTLTTSSYTLTVSGLPVPATIAYDAASHTALLTPATHLGGNRTYTATITTAVQDTAGNRLASPLSWSFTTGSGIDSTAPGIVTRTPAPVAANVSVETDITATFDEPIDASTVTATSFVITEAGAVEPMYGLVSYSGSTRTATLVPSAPLAYETQYTASITTAVTDLAGNALASAETWSFTTEPNPDTTPPTILSVAPAEDASDVNINATIRVSFDEPLDPTTVSTNTVRVMSSGGAPLAGTVAFQASDRTATFAPSERFAPGASFTAEVTTGVEDLAGNALATGKTWSFTTEANPDLIAPQVSSTSPSDGATSVNPDVQIRVTFDEPMDPATLDHHSFRLQDPTGTEVAGSVSYEADRNALEFTPTEKLSYTTDYTAQVTRSAEDVTGNSLAAAVSWSFATRGPAPIGMVVDPRPASSYQIGGSYDIAYSIRLTDPDELVDEGVLFLNIVKPNPDDPGNPEQVAHLLFENAEATPQIFNVVFGGDVLRAGLDTVVEAVFAADAPPGDYVFVIQAYKGTETDPNRVRFANRVAIRTLDFTLTR